MADGAEALGHHLIARNMVDRGLLSARNHHYSGILGNRDRPYSQVAAMALAYISTLVRL